jgi:leader peptidase (prepilin peptidase)/N-methyltransferase
MTRLLTAGVWILVGLAAGWGIRRLSLWLARREGLESGGRPYQVLGPVILTGVLFGAFAYELGPQPVLLVRSLWIVVLVQIIFFDLEHRLILDRVSVPAMVAALALGFLDLSRSGVPHLDVRMGVEHLLSGLGAGLLFLLLALIGSAIFHAEAMGMGDVKLALLMGLMLGIRRPELATLRAIFYGVLLAGLISLVIILVRRGGRGQTLAYGPYLALGALIVLYQMAE